MERMKKIIEEMRNLQQPPQGSPASAHFGVASGSTTAPASTSDGQAPADENEDRVDLGFGHLYLFIIFFIKKIIYFN